MNAYDKIRKALNTGDSCDLLTAMAALDALEKAAAEPVALSERLEHGIKTVKLYRPTLQKQPKTAKGFVACMTDKPHPADNDWNGRESREWIRLADYESALSRADAELAAKDKRIAELEKATTEPRLWLAEPVAGDYAGYIEMVARTPEKAVANATQCHYAEFRAVPLYTAPPPAPVAAIREPTEEECERIYYEGHRIANLIPDFDPDMTDKKADQLTGRAMFDAVRAVMQPEVGE